MCQPKTWQELVDVQFQLPEIVAKNSKYNRTPASQAAYNEYLQSNTQEQVIANIRTEMQGKVIDILLNKYSYDQLLADLPDVKHYCLWVDNERVHTPSAITYADCRMHAQFTFADREILIWQNLPQAKSVPGFEHYHIFVNLYQKKP